MSWRFCLAMFMLMVVSYLPDTFWAAFITGLVWYFVFELGVREGRYR